VHLDAYVKRRKMSVRQILEIMRTVCQAVQHAHQNGVIHRDLKPSNIIVSEEGQPYIVDFGLAKSVLDEDLNLTVSEDGWTAGTPAYVSPEQAAGHLDRLDTRTDVYSLGVILFVLLTGDSPHDLSGTRHEVMHRIIHQDVKRPRAVCPKIDEEAELLLLKALDHEPDRRYGSAGALAEDINNYLTGVPLQAVPPSSTYQLKKFLRRNRTLAAGIAAVILVSVAGAVVSTSFAVHAARQARTSKAISDFLRDDLLGSVDPFKRGRKDVSLEALLDIASEKLEGKFEKEPLVEASIRFTLGSTYANLGKYEAAESNLKRAYALRRERLGTGDLETLWYARALGWVYWRQETYDQAEIFLAEAVEGMREVLREDDPNLLGTISRLAWTHWSLGQYEQAEQLQAGALEVVQRRLGPDSPRAPDHMEGLAAVYWRQGRADEAVEQCEKALEISRRHQDEMWTETANISKFLALMYRELGRYDEALELNRWALEARRQVYGPEHLETLIMVIRLGSVYVAMGEYGTAELLLLEAEETSRRVWSEEHKMTQLGVYNLVKLYEAWNKPEEAEKWRAKVLQAEAIEE
jgi:tetratricopeptide (TPR) repeat protein